MSTAEIVAVEGDVVATPVEAVVEAVAMTPAVALEQVIANATKAGGVVRGLREVVNALDRKQALLCVLATDCDHDGYKNLVGALCRESGIPNVVDAVDGKTLGQLAGLFRVTPKGEIAKVIKTSSIAITNYGAQSAGLQFLRENLHF
ncbi:ribosomal protein S12e [Kipferlia bialata]|uniref:40S ribosomal protein S12 n=1 Tax=Kipferlia bialata TaxID=797122 RepID=A0A391NQ19_9EUKA|nr:ribosomal protein S12e [Kipferlia bialata]|eukprot:g11119.t1